MVTDGVSRFPPQPTLLFVQRKLSSPALLSLFCDLPAFVKTCLFLCSGKLFPPGQDLLTLHFFLWCGGGGSQKHLSCLPLNSLWLSDVPPASLPILSQSSLFAYFSYLPSLPWWDRSCFKADFLHLSLYLCIFSYMALLIESTIHFLLIQQTFIISLHFR